MSRPVVPSEMPRSSDMSGSATAIIVELRGTNMDAIPRPSIHSIGVVLGSLAVMPERGPRLSCRSPIRAVRAPTVWSR